MSDDELSEYEREIVFVALGWAEGHVRADGGHRHLPAIARLRRRFSRDRSVLAGHRSAPRSSEMSVSGVPVRIAADHAGVSKERMRLLVRTGVVDGTRTSRGWLVNEEDLQRWMHSEERWMRRPSEDRARRPGEDRGGRPAPAVDEPDPRNITNAAEWIDTAGRLVMVTRNREERIGFRPINMRENPPEWFRVPDVYTVGEVRRQKLIDVRVVAPRDCVENDIRVYPMGSIMEWPEAVRFGIVEGTPAGWEIWTDVG